MQKKKDGEKSFSRLFLIKNLVIISFVGILIRLFYWQIIRGSGLRAEAEQQYTSFSSIHGSRGKILSADGYVLVGNRPIFTLFAQPQVLKKTATEIAQALAETLAPSDTEEKEIYTDFLHKLSDPDKKWVSLQSRLTEEQKQKIADFHFQGIGFDEYEARYYPEASLAANITGFVGKDKQGQDTGYFGIEGQFNLELDSKQTVIKTQKDAKGVPLFHQLTDRVKETNGRDITLTIHRDIQYMLEQKLKQGVEKYGAKSGEVVVMDPITGDIFGMARYPSYQQEQYFDFPPELYKNPLAADAYEPGSIFKILTVSAGIDTGVITPDTQCTTCGSAREISGYTIKTWNDQYTPNISVKDGLAKSDNIDMIFIAEKIGLERFQEYVRKFEIGEPSGVELQEDAGTQLKKNWREIDLATASFGQGIATTGLQMVKAVGAVANQGKMVKPKIVKSVTVEGTEVPVETQVVGQPISPQTAQTVTDMMVYAAQTGESKWTTSKRYSVAGKTGTAQIPVSGHYDKDRTIASYIGFAPAYNPRFVMLVKFDTPQSSIYGAETAAPLWYSIATELFTRLNIPPDRPASATTSQ
ncbi:MAG: penicillin-binding protein 2 [Patescibacteria group bacterium]